MAISEKTIISSEPSKPNVPLKKSTLVILSTVVLVGGFVSSLLMKSESTRPETQFQAKQGEKEPQIVGTARAVDDEAETARKKFAEEEDVRRKKGLQESPVVNENQTDPKQSPGSGTDIPARFNRKDNTAAVYESARASNGKSRDTAPYPNTRTNGSAANSEGAKDLEYEAQSRNSRAVVSDFTSDLEQRAERKPATSTLAGTGESSFESYERQASAQNQIQNDAYKPALAAVMNAMKGNQSPNESSKSWLKEYGSNAPEATQRKTLTSYKTQNSNILHQGSVIPALLTRQINSDLPGEITASTTIDVYDSLGLKQLLIPKGSKLIGSYDSEVKAGQARLLFAFKRLIMPNGDSFDLPAARGSDISGAAGIEGNVNNHFFKMFASSLFIAVLSDKTKQPASVTNIGSNGASSASGQVLVDVSKSILERNRMIQPTITVDQGSRINVEVVSDMLFPYAQSK